MKKIIILVAIILFPFFVFAHPGNTDSSGCHTCRTNCSNWGLYSGEYHCHNNKGSSQPIYPVTSTYGAYGTGYTSLAPNYAYPSSYSETYSSCPANSYASGSSCKCNYGYVVSEDKCVSGNSYCWSKYGYNSSYDSLEKSCECNSGYKIGLSGQCEYVSVYYNSDLSTYNSATTYSCPTNSHESLEDVTKCICNSGYRLNSDKDSCVKRTQKYNDQICKDDFGSKSEWSKEYKEDGSITCLCKTGYQWGRDRKSCEKIPKIINTDSVDITSTTTPAGISTTTVATSSIVNLFIKDIVFGSTGKDVIDLQIKLGVIPATGYFGPLTRSAVIAYQNFNNIPVTGYVDLITREKLNK